MGLRGLLGRLAGGSPASPTLYAVDERVPEVGIADANLVLYRDADMAAAEATVIRCLETATFSWDLSIVNHGAHRHVTVANREMPVERIEPDAGETPAPAWLADQTFPHQPTPTDIEATVRRAMRTSSATHR